MNTTNGTATSEAFAPTPETVDRVMSSVDGIEERGMHTFEGLFAAARPGAVFGEPVRQGEYTVITASEVTGGGGFGYGKGFGTSPAGPATEADAAGSGAPSTGGGGGMGGGGGAMSRPVAVITIGPDGVEVKPVVDATKLAITALTTWAAVAGILSKIRRAQK